MQPTIELKSELEGIIKLEVIKEDGTLKEAEGLNVPFYNLITDSGLDALGAGYDLTGGGGGVFRYCRVGTSSTTPTASDTALAAQTGSARDSGGTSNSVQYTVEPYYSNHQAVYTFAVGAVSGNLTEIGFFSAESGGTMWSRALIKDSGGNPTTLTLLATEQLKVTYTVRRYIPTSLTGSFTLNTNGTNSTINYTITPANMSNSSVGWINGKVICNAREYVYAYETSTLEPITSYPSGASDSLTSTTVSSYTQGSFVSDLTVNASATNYNFATGIGSILFFTSQPGASYTGYQCSFSPKIMKTSSQTLAIGIRLSWGRTTQQ